MTDAFTSLDWVLAGGVAGLTVLGLFLGFAGQVSVVAGFAAASAAGYFLFAAAQQCAYAMGFSAATAMMPAVVVDAVFALLAFGLVRLLVRKFVQSCLGTFANCLLGGAMGLLAGAAAIVLLAGFGAVADEQGRDSFAGQSVVLRRVSELGLCRPSAPVRPLSPGRDGRE